LPARFDMAQGAGFPTVFLTAYYSLFELAHPRPGHTLLVHSAAGGVGGALLQLGRIAGCRTVGVVGSTHKVETARALGAEVVIDKSRENLWRSAARAAPRGYDVVLDANGVATLRESYRHLARPGKLVIYGFHSMMPRQGGRPNWVKLVADALRTPRFSPLAMTNENVSVLAFNLSYLFERREVLAEAMGRLLAWVDEGRITPPPASRHPLPARPRRRCAPRAGVRLHRGQARARAVGAELERSCQTAMLRPKVWRARFRQGPEGGWPPSPRWSFRPLEALHG
jgi:synaptic vesicle membrane protein VAT-1